MPIYEYACESCGHEFEKLVRVNAELPACPECEGSVRKKVSASGFILKGGGWYKDHYGLKSGSDKKGGSESKGSESKGSESKGSDSKGAGSKGSDSSAAASKGSGSSSASAAPTPASSSKGD